MANILIVEDNQDISALLAENIVKAGYQPTIVISGEDGLGEIAGNFFDLILVDVMLPGMNGFEFCRYVRRTDNIHRTKIIMLTARSSEDDRVNGFEAGADDYIVKPFEKEELIARVKAHLELYNFNKLFKEQNVEKNPITNTAS